MTVQELRDVLADVPATADVVFSAAGTTWAVGGADLRAGAVVLTCWDPPPVEAYTVDTNDPRN